MKKLYLPNVTLLAMSSVKIKDTIKALKYSMKDIEFGEVVFVSHVKPFFLPAKVHFKRTSKLASIDDFNYKMVYDMAQYVNTDFVLIIHYDGFVVHPEKWRDEFLDYDYVGGYGLKIQEMILRIQMVISAGLGIVYHLGAGGY